MSSIVIAPSATTASPSGNLFVHGHKKGAHGSASSSSTPTSTQGLFSSLLQSLEQVAGIPAITSLTAAATAAVTGAVTNTAATAPTNTAASGATPATASTNGPATANSAQGVQSKSSGAHSLTPVGASVNAKV